MNNTEKATENLDKKYKRIRKLANDTINKNIVYQNDLALAERRIEDMENRFNNLVEEFQNYINAREEERSTLQNQIKQGMERNEDSFKGEQYSSFHFDTEEKNLASQIYQELVEDYKIPQERDEIMLDTIEKYIYDKKQPNIAYLIWELADFAHCNNVQKSYKLMKAILQDCTIPLRKNDEQVKKQSFSFKESQLKESFEKEKKLMDQQCETLKNQLDQKNTEILELRDIVRLKNQDYELLKQKYRELDPDLLKQQSKTSLIYHGGSLKDKNINSENENIIDKANDQLIQPYDKSKKNYESQTNLIKQLQNENARLKAENYAKNKKLNDNIFIEKAPENDGTVVIGGMSNLNLNTTDENDVSIKNYKIEMSPIETRKDVSQVDEAMLNAFGRSAERNESRKRLDFDNQHNYDKGNDEYSNPDQNDEDKDLLISQLNEELDKIKQNLELKDNKIEELNTRINFYANSPGSNDFTSPRFIEPEYANSERMKNQRLTADKVFEELTKIFSFYRKIKSCYIEKFESCIDFELNDQINSEQMSQSELQHLENVSKDDELHFLQTLINLNKLAGKITVAMKGFYKLLETSEGPHMITDSHVENQRKMLKVKSDHQLFLFKDITQQVSKIQNDANLTKEEFKFIYELLSKENKYSNHDNK